MTEFPYINSLLPDSAYIKKEEVEKPPLCDSLGVFRDSAGVSCFFISKYFTYRHVKSLDT